MTWFAKKRSDIHDNNQHNQSVDILALEVDSTIVKRKYYEEQCISKCTDVNTLYNMACTCLEGNNYEEAFKYFEQAHSNTSDKQIIENVKLKLLLLEKKAYKEKLWELVKKTIELLRLIDTEIVTDLVIACHLVIAERKTQLAECYNRESKCNPS